MKVKELMNCHFSVYECAGDSNRHIGTASLREWLSDYALRYDNRIACAREWYKSDKDFYQNKYKKYRLPAASMCGIFPTVRNKNAEDRKMNGLIVMDIDKYDGDIEELKRKCLEKIDCAFLATKSLSGNGIYVVCHYDTYYDFESVWRSLRREFNEKAGVEVDDSCSDCSRLRILSSDRNILIKNFDADIEAYDKFEERKAYTHEDLSDVVRVMTKESYKELVECIEQLVKNGYGTDGFSYYDTDLYEDNGKYDYAKWRRDAWRLGSLERSDIGRRLFKFISRNAEGFVDDFDVDDMFNKYIRRCPDNNNVGYYFALRERLSHHM